MYLTSEDYERLEAWLRINRCLLRGDMASAEIARQKLPKKEHIDTAFDSMCKAARSDVRAAVNRLEDLLRRRYEAV